MDATTTSDGSSPQDAQGLAWTQAACADQIRQLLSGKYLNIMDVDRAIRVVDEFRARLKLPSHPGKSSVQYPGLSILHCASFELMDPKVRRGIPAALFAVIGLSEPHAPALLGADGWALLKASFEAWAEADVVYKAATA